MLIDSYDLVYLMSNIIGTYVIYKFMRIFFEESLVNKKIEFLFYALYFIIISVLYLFIDIPVVMLVGNILCLFIISSGYKSFIKKRVIAVLSIYLTLMILESIVVLLTGYFKFPPFSKSDYSSILGVITIKFLSFIVVFIFGKYKNIKKSVQIPSRYWVALILIPIGSLYNIIVLFEANTLQLYQVTICIVLFLIINLVIFYIYDVLNNFFETKLEEIVLRQQNRYYNKQFKIMQKSIEKTRSIQHDYKKHFLTLRNYIKENQNEKAISYISELTDNVYDDKKYISSGYIVLDSILNFKLHEIEEKDIDISVELSILPLSLNIKDLDMTVILGNILDNAIKATSNVEHKKITMKINYEKGILYIYIQNTFDGIVYSKGNTIETRHKDEEKHGFGLKNIEKILKKYNGTMDISYTENLFCVELMIYDKKI